MLCYEFDSQMIGNSTTSYFSGPQCVFYVNTAFVWMPKWISNLRHWERLLNKCEIFGPSDSYNLISQTITEKQKFDP
jgi:hypothetical protein